jgi:hypothetical protein
MAGWSGFDSQQGQELLIFSIEFRCMGKRRYRSTILNPGTRFRRVVSFTPLSLYPRGKSSRYPLDRRKSGPQSPSERCGKENIFLPISEIEPQLLCPTASQYTDWAIPTPVYAMKLHKFMEKHVHSEEYITILFECLQFIKILYIIYERTKYSCTPIIWACFSTTGNQYGQLIPLPTWTKYVGSNLL